jgi:hypothetical protein
MIWFMNIYYSALLAAACIGSWHTGSTAAQDPVNLGTAGNFAILAKAGISTTGVTAIVGDIGVSPIDSTAITGFSLTLDASGNFSTSSVLTGKAYASDYASPTPSYMTTAVGDMEIAYTDAAGRTSGDAITELGAGDISGMTLAPGLYKWGTGLLISTDITLAGSPCGVWIFQIGENLTLANAARVILSGGANAAHIFWQVAGEANLGTTSHFEGIILSQTAINLQTGASINGVLLAQTAVTLDASTVTIPDFAEVQLAEWFGSLYDGYLDQETGNGWIYHAEHAWLYMVEVANGIWVWDQIQQDWLWTNACIYPYMYSSNAAAWIFYETGGTPALRWFFFYDNQQHNGGVWQSAIGE